MATWTAKDSVRDWSGIDISADGTKQTAVVYGGQIYVSTNSGDTWTAKDSVRDWRKVAISADGTKQTAIIAPSSQFYVSTNSGNTWTLKGPTGFWRGIAMSVDGTRQTVVGWNDYIYVSTDSGNTWTAKGTVNNVSWWSIAMSDGGAIQTAGIDGGQLYVSTDFGETWTAKESSRRWLAIAISADGTKQTACATNEGIYVSTDSGNTWILKGPNKSWSGVAMSADGTKQTAVASGGQVYISTDSGNTWVAEDSNRGWSCVAMSNDGSKQTATVWGDALYVSNGSPTMTWSLTPGVRPAYIGSSNGLYVMATNGTITTRNPSNTNIQGAAVSKDGSKAYIGTWGGGLAIWNGSTFSYKTTSNGLSSNYVKIPAVASDGRVFISTSTGLDILSADGLTITSKIPTIYCKQVAFNTSGVAYVATSSGLKIISADGSTITTKTTANGLPSNSCENVCVGPFGKVYIGTTLGLAIMALDGSITSKMSESYITCTAVDKNSNVYFGNGGSGIGILSSDETTITLKTTANGLPNNNSWGLAVALDNRVYIATQGGLSIMSADWSSFTNHSTGSSTVIALSPYVNIAPTDISISSTSINENSGSNATVGTLSTTDSNGDAGTFTYSLVSGTGDTDNSSFSIVGSTLLANNSFNYELKNSYYIRIRSTDSENLYFEKQFTISVTNINEAPTNISLSNSSLIEGNLIGDIVAVISHTGGSSNITYSLPIYGDNASFSIIGSNLKAGEVFDFNVKNSYSIKVRASDIGGEFFEKLFTISIIFSTNLIPGSSEIQIVGNIVIANISGDPTIGSVTYNGLPLPIGSIVRNTVDTQKFIKISGGVNAFLPIEITTKSSWNWDSSSIAAWSILQDK